MSNARAGFALSLSGLALQVLAFALLSFWVPYWGGFPMMGMMGYSYQYYGAGLTPWLGFWYIWGLMTIVLGGVGVYYLGKDRPDPKIGAVLVLIAAVLAFPTMWGFFVGSLLMFLGGIVVLVSDRRFEAFA